MPRRPITIRARLVRDLSVLVLGLGLATVAIMMVGNRQAVRTLADILMSQTLTTTESRLDSFFGGIEGRLAIVGGQVATGAWAIDPTLDDAEAALLAGRDDRDGLLLPVLASSPAISSVMLADGRGREHMLLRDGDRRRDRLVAADEWVEARWREWSLHDDPGGATETRETIDYDPRTRPWFLAAAAADPGVIHWTDPYLFFTSGRPGMTAAIRLDAAPTPRIVGFDVELRDLSDFTRTLPVGERGVVTVLTGDGRLLGLPGLPAFVDPAVREAAYLQRPEDLALTLIDDAVVARRSEGGDGDGDGDERRTFRFRSGGETWWAATEPYRLSSGFPLRIAVLIPQSELLGPLPAIRMAVIGVVALVLIGAIVRAGGLARRFSAPIEAVVAESERITRGDFDPGPPIDSPVAEIRTLVAAQDHLREGVAARVKLEKIERDLDLAREIQVGLLPTQRPETPGFLVAGWNQPADATGGDYFDWMTLPDGRTMVALADATGHGIGPALIVAVCRAYMRAAALGDDVALVEALGRVNELLHQDLPAEKFVTAAVGVLDPARNRLSLISAGQAPMYFRRAADGHLEVWDADVPPMGIMAALPFERPRTVRFEPGDTLVITTDGFFEWPNPTGEMYGTERLASLVAERAGEDPDAFIAGLEREVEHFADGTPQPDDLTVLVVQRTGGPVAR